MVLKLTYQEQDRKFETKEIKAKIFQKWHNLPKILVLLLSQLDLKFPKMAHKVTHGEQNPNFA